MGFDDSRKPFLEHLREASVQLLAPGLEQRLIGGVLDQGVLETVGRVGGAATAKHELGADQLIEPDFQLLLRPVGDCCDELAGEFAAVTAPIWASSLTGASRSSRAISESCRFAGIASGGSGPASS